MSEQDTGTPQIERFRQIASELEADAEYVGVTLTLPYAQTIQRAAAKASEAITSLLADRERLTRENAELRDARDVIHRTMSRVRVMDASEWIVEKGRLEQERAHFQRRAEALASYAQHKRTCHKGNRYCGLRDCVGDHKPDSCTCGLDKLRGEQD